MRAVIQRVKKCSVKINGETISEIGYGMLIFLGVHAEDTEGDAENLAKKCLSLRIFPDGNGRLNLSIKDVSGDIMVVSQFTLYGDVSRGNRPNFMRAAKPEIAEQLYNLFVSYLEKSVGRGKVSTGIFREMMDVELVNDGPVTIIIETRGDD
jgi:D-tyrosyl-tRNA(Tyr) deacylase